MPKRIIRSKKRIVKNGKRNQRKYIKHRNLKTIKGGSSTPLQLQLQPPQAQPKKSFFSKLGNPFKTLKNSMGKARARSKYARPGYETPDGGQPTKNDVNRAYNSKQQKLEQSRSVRTKIQTVLKGLEYITLQSINSLELDNVVEPNVIDKLKEFNTIKETLKGLLNQQNKDIAGLRSNNLFSETLSSSTTATTDLEVFFASSNEDFDEQNEQSPIADTKVGSHWLLSSALKTATPEYLSTISTELESYWKKTGLWPFDSPANKSYIPNIDNSKKYTIEKLFNNYFLKNKKLTANLDTKNEFNLRGAMIQFIQFLLSLRKKHSADGVQSFSQLALTGTPESQSQPESSSNNTVFPMAAATGVFSTTDQMASSAAAPVAQAKTPVAGGISSTSWGGLGGPAPQQPIAGFPLPPN
jgi:hypothetical protein